MSEDKKRRSNTEDEHNEAVALEDPTKISKKSQEDMAIDAIKKFKSLQ